ncbi:ExbD/TolR family protein [Hymenobacter wooponensis]|uniref:Biopolymer transporter ExbD n=1 Tax=Hymenobacter wooponensis TaxID=1525360 RepID=A0A4Z0MFL0_9BACT|nr:biopolymer transporter ExbD [Hymenobacter wooponensis]TGD78304.1 biopolymer transporter ExbD [Hymenobacter wooponensis]
MAEIQQQASGGGKGGKKRAKKMSTKIDMTPMVDLAFLLLTFFMLTTTFSKPTVMQVTMPVKEKEPNKDPVVLKASDAFTVLLGENNKLYYYEGLLDATTKPELKLSSYDANGIRKILLDRHRANPGTVVLIKPDDKSNYKNMVDILDEMNITDQKKYALVDISKADQDLIKTSGL